MGVPFSTSMSPHSRDTTVHPALALLHDWPINVPRQPTPVTLSLYSHTPVPGILHRHMTLNDDDTRLTQQSGSNYPLMQHHIPEEQNRQTDFCLIWAHTTKLHQIHTTYLYS